MKIQNFPDIDLPTVTVTASLPGASPAQLETEVARKIENSVATVQGVKHIYTKVQDGTATITVEFRLEKPTQEAVDDVRDAVARVRSDLPGDLRDPVITQDGPGGHADPHLHRRVRRAWTTRRCPGSSTTTVTKALLSGARRRRGRARRRRHARGARRARPGAAAGAQRDRRRHLAPAAPGAAGSVRAAAPTSAAPSSRCAPSPPCSRPQELAAHGDRAAPTGAASGSTRSPRVTDTVAEQRSAALLNGKPVVGFEIVRSRGAGEVDVAEACARALERAEGRASRDRDHRGLQLRRSGGRELRRLDEAAVRRRGAGGARGVAVPARLARDAGRRRRRCRCRSSRPSR